MASFEEAPMLRSGVANDEEVALPEMPQIEESSPARKNRNTVLFVMWRMIWLLAATSVVVLLIYVPWPGQADVGDAHGGSSSSMDDSHSKMHDDMHGLGRWK